MYFSNELGPPIARGSWKNESSSPARPMTHAPLIPRLPTTSSLQTNSLIPPAPLLVSGSPAPSHSGGPVTIALSNSLSNPVSTKPSRDSLKGSRQKQPAQVFSDYDDDSASSSESEDYGELSLVRGMQGMSLGSAKPLEQSPEQRAVIDSQWRFHGKSSSFKLISAARKYQQLHFDEIAKSLPQAKSGLGSPTASQASGSFKRDQFWNSPPVRDIHYIFHIKLCTHRDGLAYRFVFTPSSGKPTLEILARSSLEP